MLWVAAIQLCTEHGRLVCLDCMQKLCSACAMLGLCAGMLEFVC